jgi:hypothetical protein
LSPSPDVKGYTATFDVALVDIVGVQPGSWSRIKSAFE